MERLKKGSLRRSFFLISALFLCLGLLVGGLSFFLCGKLGGALSYPRYEIALGGDGTLAAAPQGAPEPENGGGGSPRQGAAALLGVLQFVLPVCCVAGSLLAADLVFYSQKLKRPLALLQAGAARIQRQDLDFTLAPLADDELGALCASFEAMRQALQSGSRELWRQMEERRRLNAAFAHDLRNPVTVLKGAAKMLQKELDTGAPCPAAMAQSVCLLAQYTGRIEAYVDSMTRAQKLEELACAPALCAPAALQDELRQSLAILAGQAGKQLRVTFAEDAGQIFLDRQFFFRVAENLTANALRYAAAEVEAAVRCQAGRLVLTVTDDGPGFPQRVLQREPTPFLRDEAGGDGHFGLGLFLCKLLCEKHGGSLTLENTARGARAAAVFKTEQP